MAFGIFIQVNVTTGINSIYAYKNLKGELDLIPSIVLSNLKGYERFQLCRTHINKIKVYSVVGQIVTSKLSKVTNDFKCTSELFRAIEIYRIKSILMYIHDTMEKELSKQGMLKVIGLLEPIFHRDIKPDAVEVKDGD